MASIAPKHLKKTESVCHGFQPPLKTSRFWTAIYTCIFYQDVCPTHISKQEEITKLTAYIGFDPNVKEERDEASQVKFRARNAWLKQVCSKEARFYIEEGFRPLKPAPEPKRPGKARLLRIYDKEPRRSIRETPPIKERKGLQQFSAKERMAILEQHQQQLQKAKGAGMGGCYGQPHCWGGPMKCPCTAFRRRIKPTVSKKTGPPDLNRPKCSETLLQTDDAA